MPSGFSSYQVRSAQQLTRQEPVAIAPQGFSSYQVRSAQQRGGEGCERRTGILFQFLSGSISSATQKKLEDAAASMGCFSSYQVRSAQQRDFSFRWRRILRFVSVPIRFDQLSNLFSRCMPRDTFPGFSSYQVRSAQQQKAIMEAQNLQKQFQFLSGSISSATAEALQVPFEVEVEGFSSYQVRSAQQLLGQPLWAD